MFKRFEEIPEKYFGFLYHYYRAEVYRETNWRNRLDVTTNWALVVTAAIMTYVFSNTHASHIAIIMNYLVVLFFLYAESRRFRYYTLLKDRTRLIEVNVLSRLFSGGKALENVNETWNQVLADSLTSPKVPMKRIESVSWRLRRSYMFLLPIIFISWVAKISQFPVSAITINDMFHNARIWFIPGEIVFFLFLGSLVVLISLAFYIPEHSAEDDLP